MSETRPTLADLRAAYDSPRTELEQLPPMHPGEILRMDFMGWSLPWAQLDWVGLARGTGLTLGEVTGLTQERLPVTPLVALRLGRFLGTSPEFWLNLQQRYDVETGRRVFADELARIVPLAWPDLTNQDPPT